jgi:hypothetical protein
MTARRLGVLAAAALATAGILVSSAHAALFFLFEPTAAKAGGVARVRLGGTPEGFRLEDRQRPFQPAIRVYLVPQAVAGEVGSRFDPRLHFVGRIVPDRNSRGVLAFRVPPLDTEAYALAYWCPGCAQYSRGVKFGVQTVPRVSRYRRWMGLRVRLPDATETCPVTPGRHDNGFLSVDVRGGVWSLRREPGGTLSDKLGWLPRKGFTGQLTVRGERLDAPGKLEVLGVFWGYASSGPAATGSWASAVRFPTAGCWRITGRVRDIALSYVVKVVASP